MVTEGLNDYNLLKQQTADTSNMVGQNLRQRMIDLNIGAAPMTVQNNYDMGGRGNIGTIDTASQAATDYRTALSNQNAASLLAQQYGQQAAVDAYNADKAVADENNMYDTLFALYKKGKLSAKQFYQKTGYDVKAWGGSGGSSSSGANNGTDSWFGDNTPTSELVYDPTYGMFRKKG